MLSTLTGNSNGRSPWIGAECKTNVGVDSKAEVLPGAVRTNVVGMEPGASTVHALGVEKGGIVANVHGAIEPGAMKVGEYLRPI